MVGPQCHLTAARNINHNFNCKLLTFPHYCCCVFVVVCVRERGRERHLRGLVSSFSGAIILLKMSLYIILYSVNPKSSFFFIWSQHRASVLYESLSLQLSHPQGNLGLTGFLG